MPLAACASETLAMTDFIITAMAVISLVRRVLHGGSLHLGGQSSGTLGILGL
jgi:hypothetical protein